MPNLINAPVPLTVIHFYCDKLIFNRRRTMFGQHCSLLIGDMVMFYLVRIVMLDQGHDINKNFVASVHKFS